MGIIEGLAAKFNLAGDRKFNQNEISAEDEYKLQLVQKAREANAKAAYDKLASDRFNASKDYISAKKTLSNIDTDDNPIQYNRLDNNVREYQNSIDPGLAAKWMSSYKGR